MNRGRLVARVAADFGFETVDGSEELTMLQEWANEAVVDVLIETHARVELGDLTLTPGVSDYRVDASVLAVKDIDPSSDIDAEIVTLDDVYDARRVSSTPGSLIKLAIHGDLALVYPTPSDAQVLRYVYVAKPTLMTDDEHDPAQPTYGGIPVEHHLTLKAYMDWQAASYDDKRAPLTPKDYSQLYQEMLRNVRKRLRHKAQRGLAPARVGYPTRGIPRRNDTYPVR